MSTTVLGSSALEIARQVATGERSAASILEQTLQDIAERNPQYRAFTGLTVERARAQAASIDALRAAGAALPPLAGVPYAVKNLFDVAGQVTLSGGKVNAGNAPATADAVLVQRMSAAGAVLVGCLNMDEHAYGFTTENSHYGATLNPHDVRCIVGGSSGGCGAAVAAGLVPFALGSDTNGSIRVPASLCGVFGLKPTYGRLGRSGSFPFVHSLDHLGPFATSAADLALIYNALQGPDAADPACSTRPKEAVSTLALPAGTRIGVLGGYFNEWAGPVARAAVAQAAATLGARDTLQFDAAAQARSAAFIITAAEGGALHRRRLIERYAEYEPLSRDRLVAGSLIPAAWLAQAQGVRRRAYLEALRLFEHHDVLIAAATPVQAWPVGTETFELNGKILPARPNMGLLTQPISCIGLPVAVAPMWPAGRGPGALPIAVQLIAAPWREDLCLAAAAALEQAGVAMVRTVARGRGPDQPA